MIVGNPHNYVDLWALKTTLCVVQTLGTAILQTYGYNHEHWWRFAPIGFLIFFIVVMNGVTAVALRVLSGGFAASSGGMSVVHCISASRCVLTPLLTDAFVCLLTCPRSTNFIMLQ